VRDTCECEFTHQLCRHRWIAEGTEPHRINIELKCHDQTTQTFFLGFLSYLKCRVLKPRHQTGDTAEGSGRRQIWTERHFFGRMDSMTENQKFIIIYLLVIISHNRFALTYSYEDDPKQQWQYKVKRTHWISVRTCIELRVRARTIAANVLFPPCPGRASCYARRVPENSGPTGTTLYNNNQLINIVTYNGRLGVNTKAPASAPWSKGRTRKVSR